uniref:Uncharacterized protein n=1 Tax=Panagrolaimus sp. JU765 TaxID=591449 RepID=A0AC34R915_9BILA
MILIEGKAIPYHEALMWLKCSLSPKTGFAQFDVFKVVQKLSNIFTIFVEEKEPLPIIMIDIKRIQDIAIESELDLLFPNISSGFESGHGK